ncbi:sulfite exporter TauE/SafE family protein [Palleronia sp. LCG004]|uniref:sulfite exporter TauE/SafE family protein n=1 Tax=Palleronia sp. LCG004 TaxID=3079304 RepID=UPI0029421B3C|nr:sulfite exporter TauE/SafE family protein [Palleronia sp. LCG004]WOI57716.1 sulfite exporter TauE/SafE family protein [Palleronia sp. LCG004]
MPIYLPIAEISLSFFTLVAVGTGVGAIAGLFGVGGGFLLTPLLLISGVPSPVAVASVTAQVVASSASGAMAHWRRKTIDIKLGGVLVAGGAVGSVLGVATFDWLRQLGQLDAVLAISYLVLLGSIGTIMLIESVRSIFRSRNGSATRQTPKRRDWTKTWPLRMRFRRSGMYISAIPVVIIGAAIGFIGALLGIGGGFILVPALVYLLRIPGKFVIGTSLMHLAAVMAVTCFLHAWQNQTVDIVLALCLMIGSVVGAQVGTALGGRLGGAQLRVLLSLLVLGVAANFAIDLFIDPGPIFVSSEVEVEELP